MWAWRSDTNLVPRQMPVHELIQLGPQSIKFFLEYTQSDEWVSCSSAQSRIMTAVNELCSHTDIIHEKVLASTWTKLAFIQMHNTILLLQRNPAIIQQVGAEEELKACAFHTFLKSRTFFI